MIYFPLRQAAQVSRSITVGILPESSGLSITVSVCTAGLSIASHLVIVNVRVDGLSKGYSPFVAHKCHDLHAYTACISRSFSIGNRL